MARARSGTSDLTRTLAASSQPIYLLNSRRAIVYANEACGAWLGIEVEQLLGARCDYHSLVLDDPTQTIAAGLCPPPEAFTAAHHAATVTATKNDKISEYRADFFGLTLPEEAAPVMLAIVASEPLVAGHSAQPALLPEPSPAQLHVLLRWLRQTLAARPALEHWVGEMPQVKRVRQQFAAAATSAARVLIIGPPGSGREDLARAIHYRHRGETTAPLVTIACADVDAESLQLAVTSLVRQPNAAILLEDVDLLTGGAQHELRGFLEWPGFEVRTLATAQTSPLALAEQGTFDRTLAYSLATLVIELPSLRERIADLPLLVQTLIEEQNAAGGKQLGGIASDALDRLSVYSWPGDLAQLGVAIREACATAAGPQVTLADLPAWLASAEQAAARPPRAETRIVLDEFLADVERELIARALARVKNNKSKAARLLGISRPRLLRRMTQLGLADAATG